VRTKGRGSTKGFLRTCASLESRRDGSEWWRDGGLRSAARWNGGVGTSVVGKGGEVVD
jgi:hypothetical protein